MYIFSVMSLALLHLLKRVLQFSVLGLSQVKSLHSSNNHHIDHTSLQYYHINIVSNQKFCIFETRLVVIQHAVV